VAVLINPNNIVHVDLVTPNLNRNSLPVRRGLMIAKNCHLQLPVCAARIALTVNIDCRIAHARFDVAFLNSSAMSRGVGTSGMRDLNFDTALNTAVATACNGTHNDIISAHFRVHLTSCRVNMCAS